MLQKASPRQQNQVNKTLITSYTKKKNNKASKAKEIKHTSTDTIIHYVKKPDCRSTNTRKNGSTTTVANQQVVSYRSNKDPEIYYDNKSSKHL